MLPYNAIEIEARTTIQSPVHVYRGRQEQSIRIFTSCRKCKLKLFVEKVY